jgi:hypothetical protein
MGATRGFFLDSVGLGGGHNALVNLMVDCGAVGAGLWLALVGTVLVVAARAPRTAGARWDRAAIFGVMAFLLVDSVFTEGPGVAASVGSTLLFVLTAWATVLRAETSEAHPPAPDGWPPFEVLPVAEGATVHAEPLQRRFARRPPEVDDH